MVFSSDSATTFPTLSAPRSMVAVCIIVVIRFSPERRGQVMTVLG
ncbi:hypothetical protein [Mesorhizobium metallidurans]|nr:hypothetical protein [Mesorhizobium metallidurans]